MQLNYNFKKIEKLNKRKGIQQLRLIDLKNSQYYENKLSTCVFLYNFSQRSLLFAGGSMSSQDFHQ